MKVTIYPGTAKGHIVPPPSKSMAHRLLICAGLCQNGTSTVKGIDLNQDVLATLDCLEQLGAVYQIKGDCVTLRGTDPLKSISGRVMKCRESGSTLRFFVPLALLNSEKTVFVGSETLLHRPLGIYENICKESNIHFALTDSGLTVGGRLKSGVYTVQGNISSQFITGLLFALPLLDKDSEIKLIPPVESRSYINLTLSALSRFGIEIKWKDDNTLSIAGGQKYTPADVSVEADYSNAAFLSALNELGGEVSVDGLDCDSLQGDKVYAEYYQKLRHSAPTLSLADCPDLGPVLFSVAAALNGAEFTHTKRLKIKESDRAEAMAQELRKFGVTVDVKEDSVTVAPNDFHPPVVSLEGHNDHRIVMALAVLLTKTGGVITGAQAVHKSYPGFFDDLQQLGIKLRIDNDN